MSYPEECLTKDYVQISLKWLKFWKLSDTNISSRIDNLLQKYPSAAVAVPMTPICTLHNVEWLVLKLPNFRFLCSDAMRFLVSHQLDQIINANPWLCGRTLPSKLRRTLQSFNPSFKQSICSISGRYAQSVTKDRYSLAVCKCNGASHWLT